MLLHNDDFPFYLNLFFFPAPAPDNVGDEVNDASNRIKAVVDQSKNVTDARKDLEAVVEHLKQVSDSVINCNYRLQKGLSYLK